MGKSRNRNNRRGGGRGGNQNRNQDRDHDDYHSSNQRSESSSSNIQFSWRALSKSDVKLDETVSAELANWIQKFTSTVPADYAPHISSELTDVVSQVPTLSDPQNIQGLYSFLNAHPNSVKMNENWQNVSQNISGSGYKVGGKRGKLHGGDDGIYRANPQLQINLPRGIVFAQDSSGRLELALFSNRKFYGRSSGDEDDSDLTSETIRKGNYTKFVVSSKANGESCQISLCPFDDRKWIIGSKNRKILVETEQQIALYKGDTAYGMATEMAEVFFQVYLKNMGEEKTEELRRLLKLTRWTVNFEFEYPQHQHIVPLTEPKLVVIGCTGIHVPSGKSSHPIIGCAFARYFGFPTVLEDLKVYEKNELDNVCASIVRTWNSEGFVLIMLDDESRVIDFVKVKAWWYILLRAIREKLRRLNFKSKNTDRTCEMILSRLRVLQNSMNIASEYINTFSLLSVQFAEWIVEQQKRNDNFTANHLVDQYPILWLQFLNEKKYPTDQTVLERFGGNGSNQVSELEKKFNQRSQLPLLVLFQGVPGVGKSTIADELAKQLEKNGITTRAVAQDDFAHVGQKNSGRACLEFVRQALGSHRCVLLARNNANYQQFSNYLALDAQDGLCKVVFITPEELQNERLTELLFLSVASVIDRKRSQQAHPTNDMQYEELASLPLKFAGGVSVEKNAFLVKILNENTIPVPSAFTQLLPTYHSGGFKAPNLHSSELQKIGLRPDGPQAGFNAAFAARRPLNDVVADCVQFIKRVIDSDVPQPGSYIDVKLSDESCNDLILLSEKMYAELNNGASIPNDWNVICNHVTLIHSANFGSDSELWNRLKDQELGKNINIRLESLVITSRQICARVSLYNDKGECLNNCVFSKVPHITVATARGESSYASIRVLSSGSHPNTVIPEPVPSLSGIIELEVPSSSN